ncbi:tail fiber domain-containing protein, partial [bacterium]
TPTNSFGLFVGPLVGTNRYGIYQNGPSDTNYFAGKVGVGTQTPASNFEVSADGTNIVLATVYDLGNNAAFIGRKARGTSASPTAVTFNQPIAAFAARGYGATRFATSSSGAMTIYSSENFTDTAQGTRILFETTANGTVGRSERMRIDQNGNVGIGTSAGAVLHLKAGTVAANSAPLKLTSSGAGVLLGTVEDGAMEYDGTGLWFTIGSTRYTIPMNTASGNYSNVSTISNSGGSITMTPSAGNSVIVNQSTVSTSSTTGALVVNGGVGVAGAINSASNITSGGTVSAVNSMITPQIYGSSAASGTVKIDGTSNATKGNVLLASAGGNVGIGTASPSASLHVVNGSSGQTFGNVSGLVVENSGSTNGFYVFQTASVGGGKSFSVSNNGNVQVGVPSGSGVPLKFSVSGPSGFPATSGTAQLGIQRLLNTTGQAVLDTGVDNSSGTSWLQATNAGNLATNYSMALNPNGGNVGIGTTAPTSKLQVVGPNSAGYPFVVQAAPGTGAGGYMNIALNNTTSGAYKSAVEFQNNGTPKFSFGVDYTGAGLNNFSLFDNAAGAMRMFISPTGDVGLGTQTPAAPLDVSKDAGSGVEVPLLSLDSQNISNGNGGSIQFKNHLTLGAGYMAAVASVQEGTRDGRLEFRTSGNGVANSAALTSADTRMVIKSTGNVGIGTAAPTTPLHVAGVKPTIMAEDTGGGTAGGGVLAVRQSTGAVTSANERLGVINFNGSSNGGVLQVGSAIESYAVGGWGSAGYVDSYMKFNIGKGGTLSEVMRLSNNGNVGIGINSPDAILHVKPTAVAGSRVVALALQNAGNTAGSEVTIDFNPTNFAFQGRSSQIGATADGANGSSLIFRTNSPGASAADRMRIDQYGNVGIGTTAPAYKLQVAGIIAPTADGTYDLGATGFRFNTLYAVNGTVNTSDVRQKRLIENSDLGLEFVNTLRPVSYKWKVGDNEIHYGVIAQETEAALKAAKEKAGKSETTTAIV